MGDQVKNGAPVAPIAPELGSSVDPVFAGIGDGLFRLLFLVSATVANFFCTASFTNFYFYLHKELGPQICTSNLWALRAVKSLFTLVAHWF